MQLEDYFDFLASDDIRIKGTRIGIESVLYEYLYREVSPEAIVTRFPSISLEQAYATILYYLHHQDKINDYIINWLKWSEQVREKQMKNPSPVIARLRALKIERQKILQEK